MFAQACRACWLSCWLSRRGCCAQDHGAAPPSVRGSVLQELLGAVDSVCYGRCGVAAQVALDDACAAQAAAAVRLAVATVDFESKSRRG